MTWALILRSPFVAAVESPMRLQWIENGASAIPKFNAWSLYSIDCVTLGTCWAQFPVLVSAFKALWDQDCLVGYCPVHTSLITQISSRRPAVRLKHRAGLWYTLVVKRLSKEGNLFSTRTCVSVGSALLFFWDVLGVQASRRHYAADPRNNLFASFVVPLSH